MKTNQETVTPTVLDYYRNRLIESVDKLTICNDLPRLADTFSNLIYFLTNPEESGEFIDKSIVLHAVECINLLGNLSHVYDCYNDLKEEMR